MKLSVFYHHIIEAEKQSGYSAKELLPIVSNAGINAIDLDADSEECSSQENMSLFMQLLAKHNLCTASLYKNFHFEAGYTADEIIEFIDKAVFLKVKSVLCIPGFITPGDAEYDIKLNRITEALRYMCTYAASKKIFVTLEDYDNIIAPFSTISGLVYFCEQLPELCITFDTGNFRYSAEDELTALGYFQSRIKHVHIKDRSLTSESGSDYIISTDNVKLYPAVVGSGFIKIEECINRILSAGYDEFFTIEHFGAANQLECMTESAKFLHRIVKG